MLYVLRPRQHEQYAYSLLRNVGVFIISDVVLWTLRKKTNKIVTGVVPFLKGINMYINLYHLGVHKE